MTLRLALLRYHKIFLVCIHLIVHRACLNLTAPARDISETHLNLHGCDLFQMSRRKLGGIVGFVCTWRISLVAAVRVPLFFSILIYLLTLTGCQGTFVRGRLCEVLIGLQLNCTFVKKRFAFFFALLSIGELYGFRSPSLPSIVFRLFRGILLDHILVCLSSTLGLYTQK